MDARYEAYCLADPVFYDAPSQAGDPDLTLAARPVPKGWRRFDRADWLAYRPEGARIPSQGWKIHASACVGNAEEIGAAVWDHCVAHEIAFKFVRSPRMLLLRNGKYGDRGSSGKFATIYPADESQLERVLTELGDVLDGQPGPYILSDLRWRAGPLYVRYGGFEERRLVGVDGRRNQALQNGAGELVPDRRGPAFAVPPWVELPDFLAPHLAARSHASVEQMPYAIESALHFSNGGGVYRAVERSSGDQVVLKEARPHAGLSGEGLDAVARLRREREMLERLAGLGMAPAVRDHFTLEDHHFLALEYVEGTPLSTAFVARYPLIRREAAEAALAEYTAWARAVIEQVRSAVDAAHGRDVVIGDLHPRNILIRPDGRVVLIDLEIATDAGEERRPLLGAAGFAAPLALRGFDVDRYALACLQLHLFMPLTSLFDVDPGKAHRLAAEAGAIFPIPAGLLSEAAERVAGPARPAPLLDLADWPVARDAMVRAIESSASPERDDRLFPGDIAQFGSCGGLGVAHGAAGVLYTLNAVGAEVRAEHLEWLVRRAADPPRDAPAGLYDGLLGVASVFELLGRRAEAERLLDVCVERIDGGWKAFGLDLFGGLAGIGLGLARLGSTEIAEDVARAVADRLDGERDAEEISGGRHPIAGLMRGSSGAALMFIRLHELTGDEALLDLAATALAQDLRRCVPDADGALQVNEGWRRLPYLAEGSTGIGLVLNEYLRHRENEKFAAAATAIRKAAESPFYVEPGLFRGRAGLIAYLSATHPAGVDAHLRRLSWHAVAHKNGFAFPGQELLRLSMDLATGTAGVLLALGAALHDDHPTLPLLAPWVSRRAGRNEASSGG